MCIDTLWPLQSLQALSSAVATSMQIQLVVCLIITSPRTDGGASGAICATNTHPTACVATGLSFFHLRDGTVIMAVGARQECQENDAVEGKAPSLLAHLSSTIPCVASPLPPSSPSSPFGVKSPLPSRPNRQCSSCLLHSTPTTVSPA
ncbi:hypothetical protein EGR_00926 [Echinococcus granulosus]|uniref:Uncharacterized protein n=2 Tax=Echinococcus granulosus TaxID=6210 RepID=W6V0H3_ECHGR|nr:hypothetical protein EGR_00926 [Echinococcus granulosus]EUB64382.1 hypothetical protein EGR_00926 [Echinococcus granulosus]